MRNYVYFLVLFVSCHSTLSYAEHWMTDQETGCMVYTYSDVKELDIT